MKLGPEFHASAAELLKLERKWCSHSPAISAADCIKEMIGKSSISLHHNFLKFIGQENKHGYCVATQDAQLRADLRQIAGIPLMYVNKSVFILEPLSSATLGQMHEVQIKNIYKCI